MVSAGQCGGYPIESPWKQLASYNAASRASLSRSTHRAIFPTFNRFQVLNNTEFAVAHHVPVRASATVLERNLAKRTCPKETWSSAKWLAKWSLAQFAGSTTWLICGLRLQVDDYKLLYLWLFFFGLDILPLVDLCQGTSLMMQIRRMFPLREHCRRRRRQRQGPLGPLTQMGFAFDTWDLRKIWCAMWQCASQLAKIRGRTIMDQENCQWPMGYLSNDWVA